jgi:ABC-type dipeptide/oligopeptide/nickel transport system ATPase component
MIDHFGPSGLAMTRHKGVFTHNAQRTTHNDKLLTVNDLRVAFPSAHVATHPVDGVSFDIRRGETLGLVGESGSGKTLTALSILRLIYPPGRITSGSASFHGEDLVSVPDERLRAIRGSKITMVFQEPASSFNPVFTIGYQIVEAIRAHRRIANKDATDIAMHFLGRVHVPDASRIFHSYPHQLSGGTKQRAMIAMALANEPELLILDEPTTALDVTIQAGILDLLDEIKSGGGLSMLFISHDFGVISRMCDHVAVMRRGKIVEVGAKGDVLSSPKESYTKELLESVKALFF